MPGDRGRGNDPGRCPPRPSRGCESGPPDSPAQRGTRRRIADVRCLEARSTTPTSARPPRSARAGQAGGLWVEAELGEVGGKDGAHAPGARTDPDQARLFVERTGVDGLASRGRKFARDARADGGDRHGSGSPPRRSGAGPAGAARFVGGGRRRHRRKRCEQGSARSTSGPHSTWPAPRRCGSCLAERPDAVDPRVYGRVVRQAMTDTVTQLCRVVSTTAAMITSNPVTAQIH